MKIRQEINLINRELAASSNSPLVQLIPDRFSSPSTFVFEIVGKVDSGTCTVSLRRHGTSTDDATISLTATNYTRQSAPITTSDTREYFVNVSGGTNPLIRAARILVFQDSQSLPLFGTEVQIEIGNYETGKTNTSKSALTAPKYWRYDSDDWLGQVDFFVEAVTSNTSSMENYTITLQQDDGSFGSWADHTTILSASSSTGTLRTRVSFTPTSGHHYRLATVRSGSMFGTHDVYAAKVVALLNAWSEVGSFLSITSGDYGAITTMNPSGPRVAFVDAVNEELRAYDFNGSSWSLVGSGLSLTGCDRPALAALSSSRIAFIDSGLDSLRAYDFDGSAWSLAGSAFALTVGTPSLAALSSSRIAIFDNGLDSLRAYDFNGSSWSSVGSGFTIPTTAVPAICTIDTSTIAMTLGSLLRAYKFNGSTWSLLGSLSLSVSSSNPSLVRIDDSTFLHFSDTTPHLIILRWDGASWTQIAQLTWSEFLSGAPAACPVGSGFALYDRTAQNLRMFSRVGISKWQSQYLLANTNQTTTGLRDFDTLWDPAEWIGVTNAYYHEHNAPGSGTNTSKLQQDPNGSPADITDSSITGIDRTRSSALTLPATSQTLDVNLVAGTIYADRIIVLSTVNLAPKTLSVLQAVKRANEW